MNQNKIAPNPLMEIHGNLPSIIKKEYLPSVIQEQVQKLTELDKSTQKALTAAKKAEDSAANARNKDISWFLGLGTKEAVEELQSSGMDLAEAVIDVVKALKISFDFQNKLAETTKYLFGLGVSNIAANRAVVRELELKLNGASEEELSEFAKKEVLLVVKQLKDQADMLIKQEELAKNVKYHENKLKSQSEKYKILEDELQDLKEAMRKNESKMVAIAKDKEKQTQQIKKLISECNFLDEQINNIKINEKHYEENMKNFIKKCDKYDEALGAIVKGIDIYRIGISRKMFIAYAIGGFGSLLGSLALFILLLK
jgi:DNA repair exonuclease SbcCD ATPase subunit